MAHRPEDQAQQIAETGISVHLVDVEPVMGLVAAVSSFCALMTPEQYKVLTPEQTDALGTAQALLWRMEHSRPEIP